MQEVLELTCGSTPVLVGHGLEARLRDFWRPQWTSAVVIADAHTAPLFQERIGAALRPLARVIPLVFPAGETHKTRETKERLEDAMFAHGVDRKACVVALGGGIVCDVAGFVASTYMRGVAHINYATTVLAQLDAALGGKTGVNTPAGKNLIGTFHPPVAVFADLATLASLPEEELRGGLAEAVKHATISSENLFTDWERWAARPSPVPPSELMARTLAVKARVVEQDPREQGLRKVLNFGHTVAHALEMASGHTLSHGNAVAIGMVIEARLAQDLCGFPAAQVKRLEALLGALGLPTRTDIAFSSAAPYFSRDKKNENSAIHCALPVRIGTMDPARDSRGNEHWSRPVELSEVVRYWH